jgi:hypothetical protein
MVYSGAWGKLIHEENQKSKISWHCPFKGGLTPDVRLQVFSWISVPRAPKYSNGTVLNFFENSRRYTRMNVYRWCQQHQRKNYCRCRWKIIGGRGKVPVASCAITQVYHSDPLNLARWETLFHRQCDILNCILFGTFKALYTVQCQIFIAVNRNVIE